MSIRTSPPWSSAASEEGGPGKGEQKVDVIEGQSDRITGGPQSGPEVISDLLGGSPSTGV